MYLYSLIIRCLDMNKDKKIERLEKKLEAAKQENKRLKSEVRKAKKEQTAASKKKAARTITLNEEQQRLLSMLLNGTLTQDS